jgi:predicted lipid carrier protein YhbT
VPQGPGESHEPPAIHGVQERAARLAGRTLSCRVSDLAVIFTTTLRSDGTDPIVEAQPGAPAAQIRFTAKSEDIVAVAEDPGSFARAWLTGRLKVEGNIMDLLQLRKMI